MDSPPLDSYTPEQLLEQVEILSQQLSFEHQNLMRAESHLREIVQKDHASARQLRAIAQRYFDGES